MGKDGARIQQSGSAAETTMASGATKITHSFQESCQIESVPPSMVGQAAEEPSRVQRGTGADTAATDIGSGESHDREQQ